MASTDSPNAKILLRFGTIAKITSYNYLLGSGRRLLQGLQDLTVTRSTLSVQEP